MASTNTSNGVTPVSTKRKSALSTAVKVTPTSAVDVSGLSPFKARSKLLSHYRSTAGDDYVIWQLEEDVLEQIPSKLEELDVYSTADLSESQLEAVYDTLTQEEVDRFYHVLIVPRDIVDCKNKLVEDLMYADPRNSPSDGGFVMFNTFSSYLMYPVIQKQLNAATRAINKAIKAVKAAEDACNADAISGVASDALKLALASIVACDEFDHWRLDTESMDDCEKVAKKVTKVCRDLLWFSDEELGFAKDPWSRTALLAKFDAMNEGDWSSLGGVQARTVKNEQGLGRSHAPTTPAAKRAKPAGSSDASAAGSNNSVLRQYLCGIDDKLTKRVKTYLQLKITSEENSTKSALVVLSGATCMKKMNQLVAYVTGHSGGFEYHSQRGTCLKGSRIEISLAGEKLWLAEKSATKAATASGASLVVDKTVKIVQVFQGLVTGKDTGLVYDSDMARTLATTQGSVGWVSPDGKRYTIDVQTVAPQKCSPGKPMPLPRIVSAVHSEEYHSHAKTGFGSNTLHGSNRHMQGDRQGPKLWFFGGATKSQLNRTYALMSARPICREDGMDVFSEKYPGLHAWKLENVASAGMPSNMAAT